MKRAIAAIGAVAVGAGVLVRGGPDLAERVSNLEKRVAKLEAYHRGPSGSEQPKPSRREQPRPVEKKELLVPVVVTNKRFDSADVSENEWEDSIWWDVEYDFSALEKPARAIKGTLEFQDLFGDVKLRVNVTITDEVAARGRLQDTGVGIRYNQFRDSHRWLKNTKLEDMKFVFRIERVLYADGTSDVYESN